MAGELRGIGQVLQALEDGQFVADASDKLHELNTKLRKQAEARGKAKGEITIKLKMLADEGGSVNIDGEIAIKEPKPVRARTVAWLTKESVLATENPRQTKLPLREVPAAKTPKDIKDAPAQGNAE